MTRRAYYYLLLISTWSKIIEIRMLDALRGSEQNGDRKKKLFMKSIQNLIIAFLSLSNS